MSQIGETFFTAIGCIDGRCQETIAQYGRQKFGAKFPDTITEAGLVGLVASDTPDQILLDALKKKILISLEKHHSKGIVIDGHAECAGNPVDDEKQKDDIRRSVEIVKSLVGSVPVVGVFVHRSETDPTQWVAEEIPQTVLA